VSVLAAPSGAPGALVGWKESPLSLSLTHSHGVAVAAIGPPGSRVGIDLEKIEERPVSFLGDWFTSGEQAFVVASDAPPLAATLVWSAKEAVMKALREGLRIPAKRVDAAPVAGPDDGSWRVFSARGPEAETWRGWWRTLDGFVLSAVADPPSGEPERIG
jgi:4'-phosphopantetheinyl transferase